MVFSEGESIENGHGNQSLSRCCSWHLHCRVDTGLLQLIESWRISNIGSVGYNHVCLMTLIGNQLIL